jgi:hypothetical protein
MRFSSGKNWEKMPAKRLLIALGAAAVVFAAVFGLADTLNLTTDSLGAGTAVVAACQSATMNATYSASYASSIPGYATGTVTITGLTSTCYTKNFRVTLYGSGNASLGEVTGTTPGTGSSFTATFSSMSAASVTGIAVVIEG